jgi:hypothetical protein
MRAKPKCNVKERETLCLRFLMGFENGREGWLMNTHKFIQDGMKMEDRDEHTK